MHLNESSLLVLFIGESIELDERAFKNKHMQHGPHKAIAPGYSGNRIQHDFGALTAEERAYELRLSIATKTEHWIPKNGNKIRVGRLRCEIANKYAVLLGILRGAKHVRSGK